MRLSTPSCGSTLAVQTRLLKRFLFDVHPTDPATFVAASIVLMCAALVASYLPARRAATVDPLTAPRTE